MTFYFKSSNIHAACYKNLDAYLIPSPSKFIKQAYRAKETPMLYLELNASNTAEKDSIFSLLNESDH